MKAAPHGRVQIHEIAFGCMLAAALLSPIPTLAQRGGELPTFTNVGPMGTMTTGPDAMVLADYAQMQLDQQTHLIQPFFVVSHSGKKLHGDCQRRGIVRFLFQRFLSIAESGDFVTGSVGAECKLRIEAGGVGIDAKQAAIGV